VTAIRRKKAVQAEALPRCPPLHLALSVPPKRPSSSQLCQSIIASSACQISLNDLLHRPRSTNGA
jgi:hypothetical protein